MTNGLAQVGLLLAPEKADLPTTAEVGTVALLSQLMAGLILAAAVETRDQPVDLVARIREHVRTR
jgi:hypothetical protein